MRKKFHAKVVETKWNSLWNDKKSSKSEWRSYNKIDWLPLWSFVCQKEEQFNPPEKIYQHFVFYCFSVIKSVNNILIGSYRNKYSNVFCFCFGVVFCLFVCFVQITWTCGNILQSPLEIKEYSPLTLGPSFLGYTLAILAGFSATLKQPHNETRLFLTITYIIRACKAVDKRKRNKRS